MVISESHIPLVGDTAVEDLEENMDETLGIFEPLTCVAEDVEEREDLFLIGEVRELLKRSKSYTNSFLLKRELLLIYYCTCVINNIKSC